ncbi:glycosyl-transferase for dystroglycan-domain-containing protein [Haematococcus lacustris]
MLLRFFVYLAVVLSCVTSLPTKLSDLHAKAVSEQMRDIAAAGSAWSVLAKPSWGCNPIASNANSPMHKVVHCINEEYVPRNMTWKLAMTDTPAALKVAGAWWTRKVAKVPATLVTQSTVDRIPQLYSQCKSWQGPLSVALYLGLLQDTNTGTLTPNNLALLQEAILQVSAFFIEVEKESGTCQPEILLLYEVYTERKALLLYPINLLRNVARLQARTPLTALIDVDMLLSTYAYKDMEDPVKAQAVVQGARRKRAYVLPAFETYGLQHQAAALADRIARKDKAFLIQAVKKGMCGGFDSRRFSPGHNSTDYERWFRSDAEYDIHYGWRYEPWVIVDRKVAPWHDVRFRGYGQNKIQHIAHINASGFQFVVMPRTYIIHRAHKLTSVRHSLITSKAAYDAALAKHESVDTTSVYGHTRALYDGAKALMDAGKFTETLDPATINCRKSLPWWTSP